MIILSQAYSETGLFLASLQITETIAPDASQHTYKFQSMTNAPIKIENTKDVYGRGIL